MSDDDLTCEVVLREAYTFLDGEMDEAHADLIRSHLDACEDCLESVDVAAAMKALVHRCCIDAHAPDSLRMRVVSQLTSVEYTRIEMTDTPNG